MLYKFKSKASGDVIMLEPNARRILQAIGKEPGPKGIILPEQMAAAAAALNAAIAAEEAAQLAQDAQDLDQGREPAPSERVSLRQRALPFLEMLRRCEKAEREIVWGV